MIVIAPLFGIAQMVYYFGIAEYLMGIDKSPVHIPSTALPAAKSEDTIEKKWLIVPWHDLYAKWSQSLYAPASTDAYSKFSLKLAPKLVRVKKIVMNSVISACAADWQFSENY